MRNARIQPSLLLILLFAATPAGCGGDSDAEGTDETSGGGTGGTIGATTTGGGTTTSTGSTTDTGEVRPDPYIEYDGLNGVAKNPFISHVFTADPSARVFDGRVYVYASHDRDDQTDYRMTDYHVFSSDDLVNWQDHGVAIDVADISWARYLYAPDAAYSEANDKYYLYFPDSGNGIGVAVSDSPTGPFVDALGEPLVNRQTPGVEDVDWVFDPGVFIDDDGQAYLYFGGGLPDTGDNLRVMRLNDDMISLMDESATTIVAPDFFEAAFVHKYQGTYYLSYATTFENHSSEIDYLMSDNPMTGWTHAGTILPNPPRNSNNNNHHSIAQFGGNWLVFYHNRKISLRDGLSAYQRSITMDYMTYNEDGTIVEVEPSLEGTVAQLEPLDPFERIEAELIADQRGVEIEFAEEGGERIGVNLTDLEDKEWSGYSQVDFGEGTTTFIARVAAAAGAGGSIELYIDGCDLFTNLPGTYLGSCTVAPTGGWQSWMDVTCSVDLVEGVHDLYLRYAGPEGGPLLNFDYFAFLPADDSGTTGGSTGSATDDDSTGTGETAGTNGSTGTGETTGSDGTAGEATSEGSGGTDGVETTEGTGNTEGTDGSDGTGSDAASTGTAG